MEKNNYTFISSDGSSYAPASLLTKILARTFDLLIGMLVGFLIAIIYQTVVYANPLLSATNDQLKTPANFFAPKYNLILMFSWGMTIIGILITNIAVPMLNKKNPGQTIGMYIFKITPMFLSSKKIWKSILIRESFFSIWFSTIWLWMMIGGLDVEFASSQYSQLYTSASKVHGYPIGLPQPNMSWNFIFEVWTNDKIFGDNAAGPLQQAMGFLTLFSIYSFVANILVIMIVSSVKQNKQTYFDILAKTAIVGTKIIENPSPPKSSVPEEIIKKSEEITKSTPKSIEQLKDIKDSTKIKSLDKIKVDKKEKVNPTNTKDAMSKTTESKIFLDRQNKPETTDSKIDKKKQTRNKDESTK